MDSPIGENIYAREGPRRNPNLETQNSETDMLTTGAQ